MSKTLCIIPARGGSKRFPGKNSNGEYFPPIKVLRIPLYIFEERKNIKEIVDFEDEDEII